MSTSTKEKAAEETEEKGGGKKKLILILVVVLLTLLGFAPAPAEVWSYIMPGSDPMNPWNMSKLMACA